MNTTVVSSIALALCIVGSRATAADTVIINPSDDGALYTCEGCNTVNNGGYVLVAGYIQGIVKFPTAQISGSINQAFLTVNPYGLPLWDLNVDVYGIRATNGFIGASDANAGTFLGTMNLPPDLGYGQDASFDVTGFLAGANSPYVGFNLRNTSGADVFSSLEYNYGHSAQLHVSVVPSSPPPIVGPFTNGSFESPVLDAGSSVDLLPGSTVLAGWTVGNTGLVSWRNGPAHEVAPVDGSQEIGFNGADTPPGGSISQTFSTAIGQTYQVRFNVGRQGPGGGTMSLRAEVTASGGQVLGSLDATAPESPGYGLTRSFAFTAATTNSTLTFTDTSTSTIAVDLLLDNVSVLPGSPPPPSTGSLVNNGGFEIPDGVYPYQVFGTGDTLPGWTVESGTVEIVGSPYWQAPEGRQSLDLNGIFEEIGTIYQDVPTVAGQAYKVRFAYAGNPECGPTVAIKSFKVLWNDEEVASLQFDTTGKSVTNMGWHYYESTVTASSSTSRLRFKSTSPSFCGPTLDDISLTPVSGCVAPPSGLISWWPGEGNANDLAGANNGTLDGVLFTDGIVGQAFDFNGTDSQISFGNTVGNFDTNDFTVEFWIRTTATRHESVIEKWPTCGYSSMWAIRIGSTAPWSGPGRLEAETVSNTDGNDKNAISAGKPINDDLFHHVALVRRGTDLVFYIDGVPDVATNVLSGSISRINNTASLTVGKSVCVGIDGTSPFTGQLDEIAVYNRALSDSEIQAIYDAGSAGKCPASEPHCVQPPSGLVGWWKGDGTTADAVNGNDGTPHGDLTFEAGEVGQALSFDGIDDFVSIAPSQVVDAGGGLGLTIECWIRPGDVSVPRPLVEWNDSSGFERGVHFWISEIDSGGGPGSLYANLVDREGNFHQIFSPGGIVASDNFQHVALTYDKTTGTARLYNNGTVVALQNLGGFNPQTASDLYLGKRPAGTSAGALYRGLMDEVSIYDRALSADEIAAIYHAGGAGKCLPAETTSLLNIDFRGDSNHAKVGFAATGKSTNDFWNVCSFPRQNLGTIADLKQSDGTSTAVTLTLANGGGYWFNTTGDAMYDGYVYPNNGDGDGVGNLTVTISNLAAGQYDVYLYGHADPYGRGESDTIFSASSGGNNYGPVGTTLSAGWTATQAWAEGKQFILFQNVPVTAGGPLLITGAPGYNGQPAYGPEHPAILNGIQIVARSGLKTQALAHWKFDETSGNVAHDSAGSYDGMLSATGAGFVPGGVSGGALSLSKTNNGFVNMGNVLGMTNGDFSVVAWVKTPPGDTTECSAIVAKQEAGWANGYILEVNACVAYSHPGKAWFYDSVYPGQEVSSTSSVNDGNWHQIVGVYVAGGKKYIYVDGAPAEAGNASHPIVPNNGVFVIGGVDFSGTPGGWFTGLIDEVQVYNYALAGTDVDFLFQHPGQEIPPHDLPSGLWQLTTVAGVGGTTTQIPNLARYTNGSTVTVTAVPTPGFAFTGWSGDATGTNNPITITMDGNKTVTASFSEIPARTLAVVNPPDRQEGLRVDVALQLISHGDVGGMSFVLHYNPAYLGDPQLTWSSVVGSALDQVNYDVAGQVQATFALPATAVPEGTQSVATVSFRARSVPSTLSTDLPLEVLDVSSPAGNPIVSGTATVGGSARILLRRVIGDNNANDRYDVGDATIMQRLLTGLMPKRRWDVTENDVNQNSNLDSGDVIRVLRAVVGLDPQPQPQLTGETAGGISKMGPSKAGPSANASPGMAVLSPDGLRGQAGDLVTVQVRLQDLATSVEGVSFTLDYPTNALRLVNSQSTQTGAMVPAGAVTVWNVQPAQNNYALQTGRVSVAMSSATAWPTNSGVLAQFTFQVQPGQSSQYCWPIQLSGMQVTSDGYDIQQLPATQMCFVGRDPVPANLAANSSGLSVDGFKLTLSGDAGLSYTLEVSTDLLHWTPLTTLSNSSGSLNFVDPEATNSGYRFYRAKQQY